MLVVNPAVPARTVKEFVEVELDYRAENSDAEILTEHGIYTNERRIEPVGGGTGDGQANASGAPASGAMSRYALRPKTRLRAVAMARIAAFIHQTEWRSRRLALGDGNLSLTANRNTVVSTGSSSVT